MCHLQQRFLCCKAFSFSPSIPHKLSPPPIHIHTHTHTPAHLHPPQSHAAYHPYTHTPTTHTLTPSQGLSDSEETVVCKTIEAMTTLSQEKVFDKSTLLEYVSILSPFLVHPVSQRGWSQRVGGVIDCDTPGLLYDLMRDHC